MKGLETGKDKIQKICDALRKETLEPAKQEAREIVENAHLQAGEIVKEAQKKADAMIQQSEREIEERKKVFQSSLQLACRQGIEQLKQKIEEKLLDRELGEVVAKEMAEPKAIAELIHTVIRAIEEKGIEDDLVVIAPKGVSPRSIVSLLTSQALQKMQNQVIAVGDFTGGVQIQLKGRQVTLDISDGVVRELIAQYIRRDFRDLVFQV